MDQPVDFSASSLPPFPPPPDQPPPPPPPPPAGSQAPGRSSVGALWVAGLGAFLLVAAAATFVAVRWDDIPDGAKLAALVAMTLTCLQAHLRLRSSLPLTATVLLHLGVLLVPIDVAALGVRAGWTWPTMLLVQGATATLVFGLAARAERSVVLRSAAWLGVVMLAGGIGGVTVAPAGVVLAGIALAVVIARRPEVELDAATWAALAGLAVPLAGAEELGLPAAGVLADLGLTGDISPWASGLAGLLSGLALGIVGGRRRNVPAALAGIGCVVVGAVTAWLTLHPADAPPEELDVAQALLALAAVALLAEAAAWAWRADVFWFRPTGIVAGLGELVTAAVTLGAVAGLLAVPANDADVDPDPTTALALGLFALTWVAAISRRSPAGAHGSPPVASPVVLLGPSAAAVTAAAAVALATASGASTGWALAVLGGAVVLSWPRLPPGSSTSGALAVGLLTWAPVAAFDAGAGEGSVPLTAALTLAGAVIVAGGVLIATASLPAREATEPTLLLAPLSLLPLLVGSVLLAADGEAVLAVGLGLAGVWLVAAVLDLAKLELPVPVTPPDVALAVRCAGLVPVAATLALPPAEAAALAGAAAVLAVLDAVRLDRPWVLLGAGAAVPIVAGGLALDQDASLAGAGLAVTLTGVAWLGLAGLLPRRWAPPALASAVVAAVAGFAPCSGDRAALASYLLIVGTGLAAVGVAAVDRTLVTGGSLVALVGFWSHLAMAEVQASEPYIAPAAGLAVAAGLSVRQRGHVSSWIAFAPPVALLGGAALVERLDGGPAWHALVAGAVGLVAVAAGGAGRLAGPLLVGTVLLVAVTVHETLGVTAQFPTWVWLASGGTLLLATGITMERRDTGPVETGRRLVDLVREQFS